MRVTRIAVVLAMFVFTQVARTAEVKVWTSDVVSDETSTNVVVKELKPVTLVGARNGCYSGKIVVESTSAIKGVKASVSALTGSDGVIPAAGVQIRYAKSWPGMFWAIQNWRPSKPDILLDEAPEVTPVKGRALLPIWVTVQVPRETRAGTYTGEVTVQPEGVAAVKVKVNLSVADWTLPDAQNYRTWMDFMESPDTLAVEYNVPLWSEQHWGLIAHSFRLLSPTGSRTLYVPLINKSNMGNEQSMVRWIKKGDGSYDFDFTVLDRYLDTAEKSLGKPKLVIFWVWDLIMSTDPRAAESGFAQLHEKETAALLGKGTRVTAWDPLTQTASEMQLSLPRESEANKALWARMFVEIRKRMAKRGLEKTMMLSMISDMWPSKEQAAFWKEASGDLPWVLHAHSAPADDCIIGQKALHKIADIGYAACVYGPRYSVNPEKARMYGWNNPSMAVQHARWQMNWSSASLIREYPVFSITGNRKGLGRLGGDFWPAVKDKTGQMQGQVFSRYPENNWRQLDLHDWFLAPGPTGAVATARLEIIKEGVQVCETRIFLEEALLDSGKKAKIGEDLAKRCQDALDVHLRAMWKTQWSNDEDLGLFDIVGDKVMVMNGVPQSALWSTLAKTKSKEILARYPGLTLDDLLKEEMRKGEIEFALHWQDREKKLFALAGEVAARLK